MRVVFTHRVFNEELILYVLKHNIYPELTTFDAEGKAVRFTKGELRTEDEDLARSLEDQEGVEVLEGPEKKKAPARRKAR